MNFRIMGSILSKILMVEALFMIPSVFISLFDHTDTVTVSFAVSIILILVVALILQLFGHQAKKGFFAKEGLVCVGISWVVLSLLGCLPFWFSGEIPHFIDAFFEIVSGFTTTGASVVPEVEKLSRAVLYWRSFSHWLGGMGVLVFLLAVAPVSGRGSGSELHLLRAESPGPNVGKLVPKMRQTATILYALYIALTVADVLFLLAGGMPFFDSVCTAFGTAGTGGFGIKNDSIAGYSPYVQNVCTVFMMLFGVNFNCFYFLIMRQYRVFLRNEELHFYIGTMAAATLLITLNLRGYYASFGETLRHAAFQVSSIMTTTGFATTDFDLWPSFSKTILLILMVIGASAGSTGGGMKCSRVLLILKSLRRSVRQTLHPQKVQVIQSDGHPVSEQVLENVNSYLKAYAVILVLSFLLISLDNFSVTTNLSAVVACFNNIGPGLEAVGPVANYSAYSVFSKIILIIDMLAGRLEIFPILVLFSRKTWKNF